MPSFPDDFLWGVATAAYQIEGAVDEDGRRPSIWDTFAAAPGNTHRGQTAATTCNHYHRWPEDLDLLTDLGVSAYRLSFSWARLQPTGRGKLNPAGVRFYRQLLTALRGRGIRPFVTLYHWDLPQPLQDEGGWSTRSTAQRFADYVALVVPAFADLVTDWGTINEPWCVAFLGYGIGAHAPGIRDLPSAVRAAHHVNLAHGWATAAIRNSSPDSQVGLSLLLTDVVPASDSAEDHAAAKRVDGNNNRFFLDPILRGTYPADMLAHYEPTGALDAIHDGDLQIVAAPIDYLGINHYHHVVVAADPDEPHLGARDVPPPPPTTGFGWSIEPESLRNVLLRVSAEYTKLPLYITESGASFPDAAPNGGTLVDPDRVSYLSRYVDAAGAAIAGGVNLRGYFVWSLLDNFEWAEGFSQRFGLVHVDFDTLTRTPKASYHWYRAAINAGGPAPDMPAPSPFSDVAWAARDGST